MRSHYPPASASGSGHRHHHHPSDSRRHTQNIIRMRATNNNNNNNNIKAPSPSSSSSSSSSFLLSLLLLSSSSNNSCANANSNHNSNSNSLFSDETHPVPQSLKQNQLTPAASTRIINGFEVSNRRYPYAASLQYSSEPFCGAALIAPDVAITAGHCSGSSLGGGISYDVVIGRHNLNAWWSGESIRMKKEIRHPHYDDETVDNDFNLVFLERTVEWEGVEYVRLNKNGQIPAGPTDSWDRNEEGDALSVVGWGDVDVDPNVATPSDVLMETEVYAMTNRKCEQASGMVDSRNGPILTSLMGGITDNMLCARADETDACQGDSGGPLIKKGNNPSGADDVLIGIVSWGLGCADDVFPGVYSRISSQHDWIQENVCNLSVDPPAWFNCIGQNNITPNPTNPSPTEQPTTPAPVTPGPTHSPLPDGKQRLLIIIQLDETPPENGWKLTPIDDDDNVIFEIPTGSYSYADVDAIHEYHVVVDSEHLYKLTIYDTAGDGFGGTVVVYEDAVVTDSALLVKEPGFSQVSGTEVRHGFYVGSSPAQFLTLKFTFDYFAHEVAYELKNDEDGVIFALAWFQTFDSMQDDVATMRIPIYGPERGDLSYTLKVWDDGNDGICCSWGDGGYQLYLGSQVRNNDDNLIRSSDGKYGSGEVFKFLVEGDGPPTLEPTKYPTEEPTPFPTTDPTEYPTRSPTKYPTKYPTRSPSLRPSTSPTNEPSTANPTGNPIQYPTENPSPRPSPTTFNPIKLPFELNTIFPDWSSSSSDSDEDDPNRSPAPSPKETPYFSSAAVVERPQTPLLDDATTSNPITYAPTNGATSNNVESIIAAAEGAKTSSAIRCRNSGLSAIVVIASFSSLLLSSF